MSGLPYFAEGEVIKGFGRGSKELGIPTANFKDEVVASLPNQVVPGVYIGWACVDNGEVYKMAMNVGWNPFYHNEKKSMETHILHKFDEDFYGRNLKLVILEFVRPEMDFNSLEELIRAIDSDINFAKNRLESDEYLKFKNHDFFTKK